MTLIRQPDGTYRLARSRIPIIELHLRHNGLSAAKPLRHQRVVQL